MDSIGQPEDAMEPADKVDPMNETKQMPSVEWGSIPTRAEHGRAIRLILVRFTVLALVCFVAMAGMVITMWLTGHDAKAIANAQLIVIYIGMPVVFFGYVAPMLAMSLSKVSLGVEMSREGLGVGKKTADHIDRLQRELRGILTDVKDVIGPVKELVDDLKKQKTGKVVAFIEKLAEDGSVEKIAGALESIGDRIHKVIEKVEKGAVDKMVDKI